ncbi:hypothetical protein ACFO1V_12025 [Daeguia caeni]|uniref:YrhK domain-containing protein n=1 Tax=Daeguia caeni TaxID=439612 RepID=A0ABV9HAZ1_9HYPH
MSTFQRTWPFINESILKRHGKRIIVLARMHRKGLMPQIFPRQADIPFWQQQTYNGYIGIAFAVGSFLFGMGSVLQYLALGWQGLGNIANLTFFAGSIPFTIAASLQHFQSANMPDFRSLAGKKQDNKPFAFIGWHPRSAGWMSTFTQWIGTIAFNISTFSAIKAPDNKLLDTLEVWAPNLEGSILFLVSGYLAYIEAGNYYFSWKPKDLSWQVVFVNLLGCIAFMISAVAPTSMNTHDPVSAAFYSNTYTLLGAVCFFISALLLVKESKEASAGD